VATMTNVQPKLEDRPGSGLSAAKTPAAKPAGGADSPHSGPIGGLIQFIEECWAELHRVQWPNQETIIKHTMVVVSLVIFMAIYIGVLDSALSALFNHFLHTGSGS
jgi:preprotein translocase subunit SecE